MGKKRNTNSRTNTAKVIDVESYDPKQVVLKVYDSLSFNEKVLL